MDGIGHGILQTEIPKIKTILEITGLYCTEIKRTRGVRAKPGIAVFFS